MNDMRKNAVYNKEKLMKKQLGKVNCLYPMPTVIVGCMVNGKPNYITMAHVGIMTPNTISLGMNKSHFSNQGIKENRTFSINIPSDDMVRETDYCGLFSGKDVDKSELFENFYGVLETAPMIAGCPVNMECRLVQTVEFPTHDIFIGEVIETHCDEKVLSDGIVDFAKIKPILFDMPQRQYWKLGEPFAKCWKIGMQLKK